MAESTMQAQTQLRHAGVMQKRAASWIHNWLEDLDNT